LNFLFIFFFLYLWCDRVACIKPGCESTEQGCNVGKAIFDQDGRRTGARFFIWSGAVGDDPRLWVKFCEAGFDLCSWNIDGT
jgi:hypothetical protein